MIKKLKDKYYQLIANQEEIKRGLNEVEWANIFHNATRGSVLLSKTSLFVGRWAGNYSFFFLLYRIASILENENVLEFGLGESSKLISTVRHERNLNSKYTIIEHDEHWKTDFLKNYGRIKSDNIVICPLINEVKEDGDFNSYDGLADKVDFSTYSVFIVDGPIGTRTNSRFDICKVAESFNENKEFVILIDDYNRQGEKHMVEQLKALLKEKKISFLTTKFSGRKDQLLIVSEKYKFLTTV